MSRNMLYGCMLVCAPMMGVAAVGRAAGPRAGPKPHGAGPLWPPPQPLPGRALGCAVAPLVPPGRHVWPMWPLPLPPPPPSALPLPDPGAGKTNVAMLAVLHQLGLHLKPDGTVDTGAFKIVYVAPMKVRVCMAVRVCVGAAGASAGERA
jgi:hypothetical protein